VRLPMPFLCCGAQKAKPTEVVGESLLPQSPPSTAFEKLRASLRPNEAQVEEPDFKVGGRYRVLRGGEHVYSTPQLDGEVVGELKVKDTVLLIAKEVTAGTEVGLVVPSPGEDPGWIMLKDAYEQPTASLLRKRVEISWDLRARYLVKNPATIRAEASLTSDSLGDLSPGSEVLVLQLGLNTDTMNIKNGHETKARLRALVKTTNGTIGWISPETAKGDRLLFPTDLLGPQAVDIHRKSLASGVGSPPRSSIRVDKGGNGKAWEVGGKYRVLERLEVRERPEHFSKEIGKLSAGCLVFINDIQHAECPSLGTCPVAFVTVEEGAEQGVKGWVRLAAKDGHDVIDIRDQLEFDKEMDKLRSTRPNLLNSNCAAAQEAEVSRKSGSEDGGEGETPEQKRAPGACPSNTASSDGESQASAKGQSKDKSGTTLPKVADALLASKGPLAEVVDSDDEGRDERLIQENSALEDRSYKSCCTCNTRHP